METVQNFIKGLILPTKEEKEVEPIFKNEAQRQRYLKRREAEKRAEASKKNDEKALSLEDIVLGTCVLGHYTQTQVCDFTIDFLYNLWEKLQAHEN